MKIIDKMKGRWKKRYLFAWFGYRCNILRVLTGLHIYLPTETVKDGEQLQDLCNFLLNHTYVYVCLAGALWLWSLLTVCKRWANSELFTLLADFFFVYIEFRVWVSDCVSVFGNGYFALISTATAQFEMTAVEIEHALEKNVEFVPTSKRFFLFISVFAGWIAFMPKNVHNLSYFISMFRVESYLKK